MKYLLQCEL